MPELTNECRDGATGADMHTHARAEIEMPENRVIRKRIAARTTAIHVSALVNEPWAKDILDNCDGSGYVEKHHFPDAIEVEETPGNRRIVARDEAWMLSDDKGEALEGALLSGLAGRIAAFFSTHGQGIYANYGRPTLDFSGFFRDHVAGVGTGSASGRGDFQLGPLFIAFDTASAAGLTALGHVARGANLTNATVATDVLSTGAYEGTSAWAAAKIGVIVGAKAMAMVAAAPIPGARLGAFMTGFTVGAATAIAAKRTANRLKDKAIDAAYEATDRRALSGPAASAA